MSAPGRFKIALCQFPVTEDIDRNASYIRRFIAEAAEGGADVVEFSECALSGYGGADFMTWEGFDWELLKRRTREILELAAVHGVWVILGSSHQLTPPHAPHNCAYVINPQGEIVERYDKRFCTKGDLVLYSAGGHLTTVAIHGVTCGVAICYDARFPELFRAYKRLGVQCMFHPFHNVGTEAMILSVIMRPTVQAYAASNYMWVATANAGNHYQQHPGSLIRPDGTIAVAMRQHRTGWVLGEVDTTEEFYDASGPYRERAMEGLLDSANPPVDPRSADRTVL